MDRPDTGGKLVRDALSIALCVAAVALCVLALLWIGPALLLAFAGVLLSLLLGGLADGLARLTRLPRWVALVAACAGLVALFAGLGYWIGPRVQEQALAIQEQFGTAFQRLEDELGRHGWRFPASAPSTESWIAGAAPALGALQGAASAVVAFAVFLLTGVYLAFQPDRYLRLLLKLAPPARRARLREVLLESGSALRRWLVARAVCMVEVGVLTAVGLALLGVDLALALGILAGLLNFVPNFGPITAAIPAVLMGLLQGPSTAVWVAGLYVAVQIVDNYVVGPLCVERAAHLPAGISILAQIAFGLLLGLPGLLLATPLAVAAGVFIRRLYVEDVLGDRDD